MRTLALLGGTPMFAEAVPFVRAPAPSLARVTELLEPSWEQGMLTNGPLVRRLEEEVAAYLEVEHVVAVASCTAGLMLALRAVTPAGDTLMPSFTFSASAHAAAWNGSPPRFVECRPDTFQIDVIDAEARRDGVGAILATHVFGAPCDAEAVVALADRAHVPVVFDAAHAFGARRNGIPVSLFGNAAVFSMTPTKPLVAGEGGLVATTSAELAEHVRIGRDYGNPGDYDTRFVGLNARMSEMHAATALASLEDYATLEKQRLEIAARYTERFQDVPGISVQAIGEDDTSTFKDFTIAVDANRFGVDRDTLRRALHAEGVDTRCYFDPPAHRQQAYASLPDVALAVTDATSARVLSLPIYPALTLRNVDRIVDVVRVVHEAADELASDAGATSS